MLPATTACTFWTSKDDLIVKKWPEHVVISAFFIKTCLAPQRRTLFDLSTSKSGPNMWQFCHFDSKCASRHNGLHFFHIATSKSGPNLGCFDTFYFKMCFAPQRRALFPHLSFQTSSEHAVFCTFLLPNLLRATMACTFSIAQRPKVLRA